MNIFSEKNFARISFISAVLLVGVLTFSIGALFIARKIDTLKKDLIELENDFITQQEEKVKEDVNTLQTHIESRRTAIEKMQAEYIKERVDEARTITQNLYEHMKDQLGEKEITAVIKEAIRPLRFHEKQGYCFILNLKGEAVLYPADASLEGTSFFTNSVDGGPRVIGEMIEIAVQQHQGYCRYSWTKPEDRSGTLYDKISYISLFEPLGWIIGTGEYIDNLDALSKKTVIRELQESLRGDITDYFFIYQLNNIEGGKDFATMLINNNRPDLVGKNLSDDYADAKGNQFRKEFLEGIRKNGEAYVVYWYKKPDGTGVGRKLSYFKLFPGWNWVIAKGIYFDRLDSIIADRKAELSAKVKNDILVLSLIFLIGVTIALITAFYLSRALQKIFDSYRRTQDEHLVKLESLNNALEKQSRTDALTQVYNRRFFNEQLGRELASSSRYNNPVSLIIFDIDKFKRINDSLGHLAGDSVLRELAQLISANVRQSDLFARWGGEEFAILAPNINLEQTALFMEKLRKIVEKQPFTVDLPITCSFGGSTYIPYEKSEELLRRADQALYHAKNSGRNRCRTVNGSDPILPDEISSHAAQNEK